MLNKILIILCLTAVLNNANSQIEIHFDGEVVVSPNDEVIGEVGAGITYYQDYFIVNVSSEVVDFKWFRTNVIGGDCLQLYVRVDDDLYPEYSADSVWYSPENALIPIGDSILFRIAVDADEVCCAQQRLYLKTGSGVGVVKDSILLKYRIGDTDCYLSRSTVEKELIAIHPNPAADVFNVSLGDGVTNASILLYNVLGEQVLKAELSEGVNRLNIAALPNGVYYYAIFKSDELIESKKLIIRH